MIRSMLLSSVLVVLAAACGGADAPAKSSTAPTPTTASDPTPRDQCVAVLTRQRECGDIFLPALVDARIANDNPAGIAARAEAEGKAPLLAKAEEEFAVDSTDASIGTTCDGVIAEMPPEVVSGLVQQVGPCLAAEACQQFVDCIIPVTVGMWQQAAAAQSSH